MDRVNTLRRLFGLLLAFLNEHDVPYSLFAGSLLGWYIHYPPRFLPGTFLERSPPLPTHISGIARGVLCCHTMWMEMLSYLLLSSPACIASFTSCMAVAAAAAATGITSPWPVSLAPG